MMRREMMEWAGWGRLRGVDIVTGLGDMNSRVGLEGILIRRKVCLVGDMVVDRVMDRGGIRGELGVIFTKRRI